jgi:hypothetical protein
MTIEAWVERLGIGRGGDSRGKPTADQSKYSAVPVFQLVQFLKVGGKVRQWRFSLQTSLDVINLPNGSEVIDNEEEQVCKIHRTCWKINWRVKVVGRRRN